MSSGQTVVNIGLLEKTTAQVTTDAGNDRYILVLIYSNTCTNTSVPSQQLFKVAF